MGRPVQDFECQLKAVCDLVGRGEPLRVFEQEGVVHRARVSPEYTIRERSTHCHPPGEWRGVLLSGSGYREWKGENSCRGLQESECI